MILLHPTIFDNADWKDQVSDLQAATGMTAEISDSGTVAMLVANDETTPATQQVIA